MNLRILDRTEYPCKSSGTDGYFYRAKLNPYPWRRADFCYLGTITSVSTGDSWAWAWHADGRSIDAADRAFDLIDFPQDNATRASDESKNDAPYAFWLGAEGA